MGHNVSYSGKLTPKNPLNEDEIKLFESLFYDIFCSNYFLVFKTKEMNYCWRVVNKRFLCPLPLMVEELVRKLENEGKTEIALIKIKKL